LVGSFGTVALDTTILVQSVVFNERRRIATSADAL